MGGITGNTKNAAVRIENFARDIRGKLAKEVAPMLEKRTRIMRDGQTDPYGKPLAPLKPSTIRRKGGDARILFRKGDLDAGTYVFATGNRLVFTYGPNAQWAQNGAPNRLVRLVAPIYGIPKSWTDDMKIAQARILARGAA